MISHLAWAGFEIKVKQIAHSTLHFDQWNTLISKMWSLKIFTRLFLYSDQHVFWNFIETKMTKILLWRVIKNRWFWNLASVTSKMTSKHQRPQNPPSGFYFKSHFWNQWLPLIEMRYKLLYLENFHFSKFQHPATEASNKFEKWKFSKQNNLFLISISGSHGFQKWNSR